MNTTLFFLYAAIATAIAFASMISIPSVTSGQVWARRFRALVIIVSAVALINTFISISGVFSDIDGYRTVSRGLIFRFWIVLGVGLAAVALGSFRKQAPALAGMELIVQALCVSVAFAFFSAEIGKLTHDAQMRQFFLDSGYAVWFMYAVALTETMAAACLLVPKLRLPAASVLAMVMLGAIFTHARNGDPFSDSLEALHLLVVVACILVLNLRNAQGRAAVL